MTTKERIIELLQTSTRLGVDELVDYLTESSFFESPASTKFHGCYAGGLADHSLGVYELLQKHCPDNIAEVSHGRNPLPLGSENIIFAALLHDVCKVGAYLGGSYPYEYNRQQPKGHAKLSIERIKQFIELTEIEEMMIKYHMGVYGLTEFNHQTGEYQLRGKQMANAWHHNPVVKLMYFCDEIETMHSRPK